MNDRRATPRLSSDHRLDLGAGEIAVRERAVRPARGTLGRAQLGSRVRRRPETLDGIDASFLYAEDANVMMHTIKVAELEPGAGARLDPERLRARVREVAERLPSLRRRISRVPLGVHHPRWVGVERLELDAHLEFIDLDADAEADTGGREAERRALDELIAELASTPLPRDRPLWKLYVIGGLGDARLAAVVKLHHSLGDGRAAANLLAELTRDAPGPWVAPPARGRLAPRRPSRLRMFARGLARRLGTLLRLPIDLVRSLVAAIRSRIDGGAPEAQLFAGPRTFFGARLGRRRRYRVRRYRVDEVRAIKDELDVSFNDVLVATVAGAFARTRARGHIDGPPLVFSMPFGIDDGRRGRTRGNYISNELCSLCDDVSDPRARVEAVAAATRETKRRHELLSPARLRSWAEHATRAWVWLAWRLIPTRAPAPINLIISNVAGPKQPRWLGREQIEALYSVGPLPQRTGLNITAWSYAGELRVSLLGDRSQWSEARFEQLCADLDASLSELGELARAVEGEAPQLSHAS